MEKDNRLSPKQIEQIITGQYRIVEGVGAPEFVVNFDDKSKMEKSVLRNEELIRRRTI